MTYFNEEFINTYMKEIIVICCGTIIAIELFSSIIAFIVKKINKFMENEKNKKYNDLLVSYNKLIDENYKLNLKYENDIFDCNERIEELENQNAQLKKIVATFDIENGD